MRINPSARIRSRLQGPHSLWQIQAGRIATASCVFAITFLLTLGLGEAWAREDAKPSIRMLGSGSNLSLLITSGNARILIASGDDATAFGNALGAARHLTSRRIDIVILAGTDDDIPVASYARKNIDARQVFVLDGPLAGHLADLELEHDQVIVQATRLRLPGGLDVTITPESASDGRWSAVIQHGRTSVVASNSPELSDVDVADMSAAVFTNDLNLDTLGELDARVFVIPAKAAKPTELKSAVGTSADELFAIRVEPSSTESLTLMRGGIQIDGDAISLGDGANS